MGLVLDDLDRSDLLGLIEEWRFDARPFFMTSHTYDTLLYEMRRYLRRQIEGRSFLIAAHRGIGKTSLALRVVDDLRREALRAAMDNARSAEPGLGGPPMQRPLLVKLNASTLLSSAKPDDSWAPKPSAPPSPSPEAALQQLTIQLYRALASEVADAFTLHAREAASGAPVSRDLPEVAAQLTLDLDLAPDLMALRAYWKHLGRLEPGVLWPGSVGRRSVMDGVPDRGLRELVALATANQAFQICVGRVEASQSAKGSAEREARVRGAVRIDAKDFANKLFGLTAGALVGGALLNTAGSGTAAIAGLGTALFATLALGWSAERRQRTARSSDYTLIIDRSLQTLDRDLPVVIERIREAGLAPVFLIDELDKLENAGACIEPIVRRLKSLTTDYGFFFFLADRDYFEEVEEKLRVSAYPSEHTLFSYRFLLLYRPAEFARYVRDLWTIDPGNSDDSIAAWVLTCYVLHRARLNVMDVRRELAKLCDNNGKLRADLKQVGTDAQYLVPMATQLAIEHIMRKAAMRLRIEADGAFAQTAVDVLYMISRAWEDGEDEIVISKAAVVKYLLARRSGNGRSVGDGEGDSAEAAPDEPASDADITTLTSGLLELAELLSDFAKIGSAIYSEPGLVLPSPPPSPPYATTTESEGAKLATLVPQLRGIPSIWTGLLYPDAEQPDKFRFRFDRYGAAHEDLDETFKAVVAGSRLVDDLSAALKIHGLSLEDLLAAGVMPATLQEIVPRLPFFTAGLRRLTDTAALSQVPRDQIDGLTTLAAAVRELRQAIIAIVALVAQVQADFDLIPRGRVPTMKVLVAIDRLLGIEPLCAVLSAPVGTVPPRQSLKSPTSPVVDAMLGGPAADVEQAGGWAAAIAAKRDRLQPIFGGEAAPVPGPGDWPQRVTRWLLRHERPVDPPIGFADLAAAVADSFPAADLRPDPEMMTIAEWSRFTKNAFAHRASEEHWWAFAAGLSALAFGQPILGQSGSVEFVQGAPHDQPAVLLTFSAAGEIVTPPDPAGPPVLAIPIDDREAYAEMVLWLLERVAFGGMAVKED